MLYIINQESYQRDLGTIKDTFLLLLFDVSMGLELSPPR